MCVLLLTSLHRKVGPRSEAFVFLAVCMLCRTNIASFSHIVLEVFGCFAQCVAEFTCPGVGSLSENFDVNPMADASVHNAV